jgi:hypothetical protein
VDAQASSLRRSKGPARSAFSERAGRARTYLQWVVDVLVKTSIDPVWSNVVPSIVIVPASSANVSVVVVLVVQPPDFVVERDVVVETGPVGVSCADTVTVLDDVHVRRLQSSSVIEEAGRSTDMSAPTVIVPLVAHPNSSEMTLNLPLLEIEYLKISRHGGPSDPSSFDVTERFRSVQTWRPPDVEQLDELLKKFVPFGDVSAATDPTVSRRSSGTVASATPIRRMRHVSCHRDGRDVPWLGPPPPSGADDRSRVSRGSGPGGPDMTRPQTAPARRAAAAASVTRTVMGRHDVVAGAWMTSPVLAVRA